MAVTGGGNRPLDRLLPADPAVTPRSRDRSPAETFIVPGRLVERGSGEIPPPPA